jgi:hypothetical protein
MPLQLRKIIKEYYAEMNKAMIIKQLEPESLHLADDAKFIGINEYFEGKKNIVNMLRKAIFQMQRFEFKKQYFDDNSCCSVLDIVTQIPHIRVPSMDCITVQNGQIIEVNILYDIRAWEKFMKIYMKS